MMLLRVGGVLFGLRLADKKSRLMLTEGSDHVEPRVPGPPTFCCWLMGCCGIMFPKLCCERDRGMLGKAAPPKEKVRL